MLLYGCYLYSDRGLAYARFCSVNVSFVSAVSCCFCLQPLLGLNQSPQHIDCVEEGNALGWCRCCGVVNVGSCHGLL